MGLYEFVWGKHSRHVDGVQRMFDAGDTIELTADEAERLGEQVKPAGGKAAPEAPATPTPPVTPATPPEDTPVTEDTPATVSSLVDGHWSGVCRRVRALETTDEVRDAQVQELAGKARDSVLKATKERLAELGG